MGLEERKLTMAEKRDFLVRMNELIRDDVLNYGDQRQIFLVCLAACERELSRIEKED